MNTMSNVVKGFTLIEMMVTLSIAAILMSIAVPSYNTFSQNSRISKQVNLLVAAVSGARGEAAKRGGRVGLCQSSDPTNANPQCSGTSGTWSNGWVVFVDTDNNSVRATDGTEPLISAFQAETGVDIKVAVGTALVFNADGSTVTGATEFAVCDSRGVNYGKKLNVAGTGRPSTGDATTCSPA